MKRMEGDSVRLPKCQIGRYKHQHTGKIPKCNELHPSIIKPAEMKCIINFRCVNVRQFAH